MEKEKDVLRVYATLLILTVMLITLGYLGVKLRDAEMRLAELEKGTSESFTAQQAQLDTINGDIKGLWDNAEAVDVTLESLSQEIEHTKQVQSNTNSALTRLRKQKEELEKKLEEGLELRRQRLAELQARWSAPSWDGIGGMLLTAYEWTGRPCANGNYPTVGYTCASNYYPLGTRLWIEGIGERVVEDTGGMGMNVVDIYMGDEETCIQFGVQEAQITVIEE